MKTTDVIISKTSGDNNTVVIVFACEKHRYFFTCENIIIFSFWIYIFTACNYINNRI